ncbi:unnamed protein product [Protopolystoma xenopodis]|uniref:Collagen IV NC1 domain-containing protein n=1 Tax=Protopolystoma xenopodis TaxID=117903 RepID=A0A3S5B626_9PLAT|nr:unnamed protein product [Protopolystoma xenopodis]
MYIFHAFTSLPAPPLNQGRRGPPGHIGWKGSPGLPGLLRIAYEKVLPGDPGYPGRPGGMGDRGMPGDNGSASAKGFPGKKGDPASRMHPLTHPLLSFSSHQPRACLVPCRIDPVSNRCRDHEQVGRGTRLSRGFKPGR